MHTPGRYQFRLAMLGAMMDAGKIQESIARYHKKLTVTVMLSSREITQRTLHEILGMMDVYGTVITHTWDETISGIKGKFDFIEIDSLTALDMKTPRARPPEFLLCDDMTSIDQKMIEKLVASAQLEIAAPVKAADDNIRNRGRASKGDRHKNKRYRWS